MRRRDFIAGLGGATAWPLAARAQGVRHLGVLWTGDENDPFQKQVLSEFTRKLEELGWTDGRNLRMDVRLAAPGNAERMQMLAKELVALKPEVIQAGSTPATAALRRETRTIPIVFGAVSDPVGEGFVASLPRPGGNLTGFINLEASMCKRSKSRGTRRCLLPPPNRNRLLPISIAPSSGRNPRIRGFDWGRAGVGGREAVALKCQTARPPPPTPPHKGEGRRSIVP
jgi:hypothetical protein